MENLLEKLSQIERTLTSKQRMLCHYIIKNCRQVSIMPIGELSDRSGVGRATIMRLLSAVGYSSYTDFKRDLNFSSDVEFEADKTSNPFFWSKIIQNSVGSLTACANEIIPLLQKTVTSIDSEQFDQIVDLIIGAQRVNILGLRSSSAIAKYTAYQFQNFVDAYDLSENESMVYDRLYLHQRGEMLFLITTQPTTTTSVRIAQLCKRWEIPVVVITDDPDASILQYATTYLCVARSESSRLSILPHMLVIEALVNELGVRMAPLSVRTLDQLNQLLLEENVIQN